MFGRSVVLLIDHTSTGSMGLIMNKQSPILLNEIFKEFKHLDDIPLHSGGPLSTDTLFFLHTIPHIEGALSVRKGLYMNGDFDSIKRYIMEGNPINGYIRFFLGYSGWDFEQLKDEIRQNTWIVGKSDIPNIMNEKIERMWKKSLEMQGSKYGTWSRFPQIPSLN
jgi:Putative transcriptional regulator